MMMMVTMIGMLLSLVSFLVIKTDYYIDVDIDDDIDVDNVSIVTTTRLIL